MNTERIAEIQKIRNCVPFIDNGAGVPETQAAIDELLAENASLKAEAERNQWALNALVALEAAVRESVIRPTKDTEINTTNELLTLGALAGSRSAASTRMDSAIALAPKCVHTRIVTWETADPWRRAGSGRQLPGSHYKQPGVVIDLRFARAKRIRQATQDGRDKWDD